jgi:hypothetical protein
MHWVTWAFKWSKYLGVGLLHDVGWLLGLWVPHGDGFSPERWCTAQRWESMVRWHCDIVEVRWRPVEGGPMLGIRRVYRLWRWARAEEKRVIKLARDLSGLDISDSRTALKFLDFLREQQQSAEATQK